MFCIFCGPKIIQAPFIDGMDPQKNPFWRHYYSQYDCLYTTPGLAPQDGRKTANSA